MIGQASRQVYEALGRACTKHTEHQAHFCVEVEQAIIHGRGGAQVRFNMAFGHLTLAGTNDHGDLIWFVVDSSTGEATAWDTVKPTNDCSERLYSTLKRNLDPVEGVVEKKTKKCVRFDSSIEPSVSLAIPPSATLMKAPSVDDPMRKDFCDFLCQRMLQGHEANVCGGVLENSRNCRNFVYSPAPTSCPQRWQAMSLGQLITLQSAQRDFRNFSLYDRLHLAKTLAVAVLQYHSTPWLRATWRSEDIYFFCTNPNQLLPNLSSPHLNVRVKGPDGQLS